MSAETLLGTTRTLRTQKTSGLNFSNTPLSGLPKEAAG